MRDYLKPGQFKQAAWQGVKRAATSARAQVGREIKKQTYISAKYAKDAIKLAMDRGDAPQAELSIKNIPLPAIAFPHSALKKGGVSYGLYRDRPRIKLRHAFIATMPKSGHQGVFLRMKLEDAIEWMHRTEPPKDKKRNGYGHSITSRIHFKLKDYVRWNYLVAHKVKSKFGGQDLINDKGYVQRLPIDQKYGPSAQKVLRDKTVLDFVSGWMQGRLYQEIAGQLSRFTKQRPPAPVTEEA